ncbi:MAG: triosephosphate isomerase [Bacteroidetes bacterium]|uniref:triose-phosphate isomerase n=1 Tax=unclassified Chitinophaga TaxID=2619133 RepID=UPI0009D30EA8|nr:MULTISPECIES: triose-phosphate isomerase [unclassified Chitinophaga]MBP1651031.1 triosephosphate isomerase [Bacteroidota bacterium]OMP78235.1 triose-phosphate isomerase [[Flexibacter] sp. ATCC 35208]WPV66419.1 triose-phosphate isomerase [Chitinophaga sp. LS1]
MRKKIVAGNWKMNLTLAQGEQLINDVLAAGLHLKEGQEVVFATPFPYLVKAKALLKNNPGFFLASQNSASEKSGAYTGEVSAEMLQSVGVDYVILGHSERREYFQETNAVLAKKIDLALANGLKPLFCCGEPLEVRKAETQNEYVAKQLEESLYHLTVEQLKDVVIAYEPIWAIGTGLTASAAQAQDMHAFIRAQIAAKYGREAALNISILYGGSAKPSNAVELFSCPDVDGGLIGGASLVAADFVAIVKALA